MLDLWACWFFVASNTEQEGKGAPGLRRTGARQLGQLGEGLPIGLVERGLCAREPELPPEPPPGEQAAGEH